MSIPSVMDTLWVLRPRSVLDVGIGFGKYGYLIRDMLDRQAFLRCGDSPWQAPDQAPWEIRLDGIEVFEPYLTFFQKCIYSRVLVGNALEVVGRCARYEVILLLDVLEHFSRDDGARLLRALLERTEKVLIVSVPAGRDQKQDTVLSNTYERHLSVWTRRDLKEVAACTISRRGGHLLAWFTRDAVVSAQLFPLRARALARRILSNVLGQWLY